MTIKNSLHIELTNRCTLECPACPRTVWKDIVKKPVIKKDLDLEAFAKFLDCPSGKKIKTLILCGDYGDSIYYPRLIEFIQRFRDRTFEIQTAGSHRSIEFWKELNTVLTEKDSIIFGIDGLEDTNHLYRKNSNWNSIMTGLDIMVLGPAKVYWQTIIFSFNQDKLENIKNFAESKGTKFFTLTTSRFRDENLRPTDNNLVAVEFEYKKEYNTNKKIDLSPRCELERVITSDGYLLPCNWIRHPNTFYKSDLWLEKDQWLNRLSIDNINLDQGLEIIKEWKDSIITKSQTGSNRVDTICKMLCRKGCEFNSIGLEVLREKEY